MKEIKKKQSTKSKVLLLLESHRGESVSGEDIAASIGVSRSAVWKAIDALRKEGHDIIAATNNGYSLSGDDDIISAEGVNAALREIGGSPNSVAVFDELPSTNTYAKEIANKNVSHGTVIIAKTQTQGRGRFGRSFYSPLDSGLYMSIIISPEKLSFADPTLITMYTAVKVCEAIEKVYGKNPQIKWVNDIYLDGKKVCGILTEAASDFESGQLQWIVVGIGVNIAKCDYPAEIKDIAGSLLAREESCSKNKFAAEIIKGVLSDCAENIIAEYKKRLLMLGKTITVHKNGISFEAYAVDIDENAGLIIKKADGNYETLRSGEVSVKI